MTILGLADQLHVAHSTAEEIARGMDPRMRPSPKTGNLSHYDATRFRRALLQVKPAPRPPMAPAAATPMLPGFAPEEASMFDISAVAMAMSQAMTVRQVAEALGVSDDSVLRIVKDKFPELVRNGRTTYLAEIHVTAVKLELEGHHNLRSTAELQNIHTALERQLIIRQAMALQDEMIAELQEQVAERGQALALAATKVEAYDRLLDASGSLCISDVAKQLGSQPLKFFGELEARGYIFRRSGDWLPAQYYLDKGYFVVKTLTYGEGERAHVTRQTRVTPKGLAALAKLPLGSPLALADEGFRRLEAVAAGASPMGATR
jgi:phage antirepressor YoqD-like protein